MTTPSTKAGIPEIDIPFDGKTYHVRLNNNVFRAAEAICQAVGQPFAYYEAAVGSLTPTALQALVTVAVRHHGENVEYDAVGELLGPLDCNAIAIAYQCGVMAALMTGKPAKNSPGADDDAAAQQTPEPAGTGMTPNDLPSGDYSSGRGNSAR